MKPLKLKPEETKSLASGGGVIWREAEYKDDVYWCPTCPYQPGAEFWVMQRVSPALVFKGIIRVVSVSPEKRENWGWRVELEVI